MEARTAQADLVLLDWPGVDGSSVPTRVAIIGCKANASVEVAGQNLSDMADAGDDF